MEEWLGQKKCVFELVEQKSEGFFWDKNSEVEKDKSEAKKKKRFLNVGFHMFTSGFLFSGGDDISCISRRTRSWRICLFHSTDLKEVGFTVSLCLQLVEVFLKMLSIWDQVDLICHTIKLLFTCIREQRREFEDKPDREKGQLNERKTIDRLLRSLRDSLSSDLSHTMSHHHKSELLARELTVWSK